MTDEAPEGATTTPLSREGWKYCTGKGSCGAFKELDVDFQLSSSYRDGHHKQCSECRNRMAREHHAKLLAGGISDRERRKPVPADVADAHLAVTRALRAGTLVRLPCQHPGCRWRSSRPTEAHHHKGYAREYWLDVIWLCRKHHIEADHKLGGGTRKRGKNRFAPKLKDDALRRATAGDAAGTPHVQGAHAHRHQAAPP